MAIKKLKLSVSQQLLVDAWLELAWRDGFLKGQDGRDDLPDFMAMCPSVSDPSASTRS